MKNLSVLFVSFVLFYSNALLAESRISIADRPIRTERKFVPEILTLEGKVVAAGSHRAGEITTLEFVEQQTGETYNLKGDEELKALHNLNEKDLIVKITAERTPKFLFWGGALIVKQFEVLGEVDSKPHLIVASHSNGPKFSRFDKM